MITGGAHEFDYPIRGPFFTHAISVNYTLGTITYLLLPVMSRKCSDISIFHRILEKKIKGTTVLTSFSLSM